MVGMIPYSLTATSHPIWTLGLSVAIIIATMLIGLDRHKIAFISVFIPYGTPLGLVPFLVIIELLSYSARAVSLGVRLAANCIAGHTLLKIISTFTYKVITTRELLLVGPLFLLTSLTALVGLEIGIAILQSYVFTILTCSYIKDSLNIK